MAAELKISGKMSVKKLKENFKNEFGGTLRVYDGRSKADDDARLASIRRKDDAKGGELVCNGHLTVGGFEKRMLEIFGIKVQVATPDDWTLALDGITLFKLKDIPEKSSKADMESLVAYKRKDKSGDVATEVEDTEGIVNADETPKTKQVRLAIFAAQQPRLISFQTLCEDDMEVVDENGASVETYEHLVDHGSGEWVNLAFVPSGCCVELNVTDPNADDDDDDAYVLYSDDEFEIYPNYGMMNMQEAKENYEDDSASIERYTAYLNVEMGEDYDRLTNKGLKVAWERLKTNEVNAESYVPAVMQYVMSEEGGDKAFLQGLQVEDITMVFNIDIPEGEEFDPSKLDFINMDAEYEDNSEVLSELLAADMLLLNAIIYDGKMYFADGYDDVTEDPWGEAEYYYDIVHNDEVVENDVNTEALVVNYDCSEEEYPLIDKLREAFIVETDDEVYYDAESASEYAQDRFINNIKAQMTEDEIEVFESLQWNGAEAFTRYLEDCPDDFDLRQKIITAAYCTRQCIDIDDDTRLCVDDQLYYFNDCMDFHFEYEVDIDLG